MIVENSTPHGPAFMLMHRPDDHASPAAPDGFRPTASVLIWSGCVALLLCAFLVSLLSGPFPVSLADASSAITHLLSSSEPANNAQWVVAELRLPRALLAALIGAGLGVAGCITQGVFRNPLADPGLIGVSGGAALAAVSVIVLSGFLPLSALTGPVLLPLAAFAGALAVTWIIYRLGTRQGHTQVALMLLAGIAVNVVVGAATGLLTFVADDDQLRDLVFWSMGSLAHGSWPELLALLLFILLPVLLVMRSARLLNALMLGEAVAGHLGFDVQRQRRWLLAAAAMMAGAAVAVAGVIGFIGLVVPHVLRLLSGPDHRILLPLSALTGASLLLLADTLCRVIIAPAELPVGLMMALTGGPVFILLLVRQSRRWL